MESNHDQWYEKPSLSFNYKNTNDQHPKNPPTNKNCKQCVHWPPSSIKHLIIMKLWLPPRYLLSFADPNRPIPSNTLHIRYNNSVLLCNPHLPRCKLWLNHLIHTCKRGINIFYLPFMHVGRGLYYGSYTFLETWNIRVILLFATIATAFIGYVLPWGQISFWGATMRTDLRQISIFSQQSHTLAQI